MRKHLQHFLMTLAVVLFSTASVFAQQAIVTGKIVDENGEAMIGASVIVPGTSQGVSSDVDGYFRLKTDAKVIEINFVGYATKTIKLDAKTKLGTIKMEPDAVALQDVIISQSIAVQRKTPVAVSTVNAEHIDYKLGSMEFPEILKSTPGVYVTKQGGGYGDSKINMRGFKAENVAVMVNGVPVNDMEWGGVYWSNWAGLSDVTRSMQTQRGLGASKISSPSVGGTVNIVTKGIEAKRGGTAVVGMGNDGLYNVSFSVSTGLSKSGWAMTLLGAKRWGDGYIRGTEFEGYNWFINISKRINTNHQISLTAFGAPQKHNRRKDGMNMASWQKARQYMGEKDMYRYNPTYGFDRNGQRRSTNENIYHKPQISLNHQWQINNHSSLSSVLYMSIGRGSGMSGQAREDLGYRRSDWYATDLDGNLSGRFLDKESGLYDYGMIQDLNRENPEGGAKYVMSRSKNHHMWYGFLSTYTNKFNKNWELSMGVDVRYYVGQHTNEICDLYDGEYFMDINNRSKILPENNAAAAKPGFVDRHLNVGDVVYRDYDGHLHQEGVFAQLEWSHKKVNAFVSGSLSNTGYWRVDRLYYDAEHGESPHTNCLGGTFKAGLNYNINDYNNVFFNVGYISRAPFFKNGIFLSAETSHMMNPDPVNEKVFSAELGYGLRTEKFALNFNAYYTTWMDKTTVRSTSFDNGTRGTMNMSGVDARHMGLELDFRYKATRWLDITGMVSVGDWKWDSNAKGYLFDDHGQPLTAEGEQASGIMAEDHAWYMLNQKGVRVGGSAQTTAALGLTIRPLKGLRISADWNAYASNYSDFDIKVKDLQPFKPIEVKDPWQIPWGHQLDLSASYRFKIGKVNATLIGNVNNVYNYLYVMDAKTRYDKAGDWTNATNIFYSFGRTYTVRLKINF